ncbi:MAG: hypothetical protein GWN84_00440, partial [Gammaproteobacteria bacterium]|nr:hypothetical protein [Gammaproteobacteria bacterium]NIR81671.1 hypothetical protein [Gammaproteobacteria bacterium]NIR88238.1 hypothetical protein [Gammaproteobacteria bacterium]NIU02777.1 hypothetical protein [Gammaproteobacteria bacterium]NIV73407.1 hypothetical protein [Gammaproteobacteria bacterium]
MAYSNEHLRRGIEAAQDPSQSAGVLESRLSALEDRLRELPADVDRHTRAVVRLEMGRALVGLERGREAWDTARECFDVFLEARDWQRAAEVCDVLFLSDQPDSLAALGQGIWLAVTFPVDPELTVALLERVIDETPRDSDGAAVAAAVAAYVVDLRAEEKQRENLAFYANQMLGNVARRHSSVESQEQFEAWMRR